MRHGTRADAAQVPVRLTVEEIADRGESMATKLLHINALRASRLKAMQDSQKLIDAELDELGRLARVVMDSSELRRQGDLFRDQQPDAAQATEALAEVAKRAERSVCAENGSPESVPCEACPGTGAMPVDDETLATVSEIPEACGDCGNPVRGLGDHVYTCSLNDCPWTVRVVEQEPEFPEDIAPADVVPDPALLKLSPGIEAAPEETAADKIKRQRREKRAQRLAQVGAAEELSEDAEANARGAGAE